MEVYTALKRYLRGCEIALEGSKADEEPVFVNSLIVRLHGRAFEMADVIPLKTVKQQTDFLRELYLKPKDLDTITDEIRKTYQRRGESVRHFSKQLEILRNDAKMTMLKAEWHTEILLMEFYRKMTCAFVMGLNDIHSYKSMFTQLSG